MLLFSYLKFKNSYPSVNCCIDAVPVYFATTVTTVLQYRHLQMYRAYCYCHFFSLAFKH